MYAIISDRGSQYKVREGDALRVDKMPGEEGQAVSFEQVLLVGQESGVRIGQPHLAGAKVSGVIEGHIKGVKTIAIRRIRTNKHVVRRGHRTQYTVVKIGKIEA